MEFTKDEKAKLMISIQSLKTLIDSLDIEDPTVTTKNGKLKFKLVGFLEEEVNRIVKEG